MAELIREALRRYIGDEPARQPPGAGAFASGRKDTASNTAAALSRSGFGKSR
jgi:hypothetical protein